MKTRSTLAATALLISPLTAAVTPYTEDFSSGAGSLTGWTDIGAATTAIQHSTGTNDSDDSNYDPVEADGGGDNAVGDGALQLNTQDATQKNEEIAYTFAGTMALAESYTLDIACFNNNNSYNNYSVSLWNKTDGVMLAATGFVGQNASALGCRELQLSCIPGLGDDGDELEVRILENCDATSRDVWVDEISLSVDAAPASIGPFLVADLRLDESLYPGAFTYFDPGFGPLATRTAASGLVNVPCGFSGTSSRAGGVAPDDTEDIGLRSNADATVIRTLNRGTVDPDGPGGVAGPQSIGVVQWTLDLSEIDSYLCATGRQLDSLDLRLVTNPSDDLKKHNVYLSYTLPAEGMTLTPIDPADDGVNYDTFWLPAHVPLASEGDLVNGTHKVIKIDTIGDFDVTTDLSPLFNAGVREVTLVIDNSDYYQNRNTEIQAGSGLSFSASTRPVGIVAVSEDFSSGISSLAGWTSSGSVDTTIAHTTNSNDSDAANYDAVNADSGGDDSAGDGGLLFDSQNAIQSDEQISYVFGGLMGLGETYTVDISCYNPMNNYNSYKVILWNKTDDVLLADNGGWTGLGAGTQGCRDTQVSYTPKLSDQGDILELRILENHNHTGRDVAIDAFSLTIGTPPDDTGLLYLADLRLPVAAYSGAETAFDPGFGPEVTRAADLDSGPFEVATTFRGTSQNPGGTADSDTDIRLRTWSGSHTVYNLNRYGSDPDGDGPTGGPQRSGAVQWTIDLGEAADYLAASGKQLDTLDLRLVTSSSETASKTYDVYLSYTSPGDGITLTDISSNVAAVNYDLWFASQGSSEGSFVGTTHRILKLAHYGALDLTTDLAPLLAAGVREVNLIITSGAYLQNIQTGILAGSGLTFRASDAGTGTPFESFMENYPDLTGDDALPGSDPDFDGLSNVAEFIMGGSAPNDSSMANLPVDEIIGDHMTISLLVPTGATFAGTPSPSATVEGVDVTASGSLDLATFGQNVEETTVNPAVPAAPGGYDWHTFRLTDTIPSQVKGFLRISFE